MIRKIELKDKAVYIKMAGDFYNSSAVLSPVPTVNFENTFDELMKSDTYAEAFIFEFNETIAGYGLIAKTYSQEVGGTVIWIEEIYVKEDFRNQGLGSEFINYVKENIPAKRYRLETEPENIKAQELYKRHGFKRFNYINYSSEVKL
ncbi:MAG: GNAT family N-acetyltransferase [Clostridia bacterium]|nr:GNAT family N-acetyltransferase [Clostridia bacterium]